MVDIEVGMAANGGFAGSLQGRKISGYAAFVLTVLLVGRVLSEGFHGAATFLGLFVALQTAVHPAAQQAVTEEDPDAQPTGEAE